jgi:Tfp pilus assembly protein PilO
MKTETDITNKVIRSKERIGPFRKLHILYACCALSGLIILIFAYEPSMIKLHDAANRLREVQIELLNQRNTIASSERSDVRGEIMQQNEVPLAIAELSEKGRELGLDFGSISPGDLQQTTQAGVGILPIAFAIESRYQDVGKFLVYAEKYSSSIVVVESFICAKEKASSELGVDLVLNLYVDIEDATQR